MRKTMLTTTMIVSMMAGMLAGNQVAAEDNTRPGTDRAGKEIRVPEEISSIICMAPSTAQILEELGLKDKLIAVDYQTPLYMEGVDELPQFDMMTPDCEAILALDPDIVFVTGMSYQGDDPYEELEIAGICVAQIPSSDSLAGIQEDIQFVADCFGMSEEGTAIVEEMQESIDEVAEIGAEITEKKSVLFEIASLPNIYSFGKGVFLQEMLELIGAENVFADQDSWISVTEEAALAANPDVILTSVDYTEDPVDEILSREGWENVEAVQNQQVYYIDTAASSQPNQNVVTALQEMAKAIYPEEYAQIGEK